MTDQPSEGSLSCEVTVDVDAAWFPGQSSLRPGQTQLDPHTKAYVRYKFYDKGESCRICVSFDLCSSASTVLRFELCVVLSEVGIVSIVYDSVKGNALSLIPLRNI